MESPSWPKQTLSLEEKELASLLKLADGKTAPSIDDDGLASLIKRGVASVEGGKAVFTVEVQEVMAGVATCRLTVLAISDNGDPIDQYCLGEDGTVTRVTLRRTGLEFEGIAEENLGARIAGSLAAHLASAKPAPLPNSDAYATAAEALGKDGLAPLAWAGLSLNLTREDENDADGLPEWVVVVRCEKGFVWHYAAEKVLALAENEKELAQFVEGALVGIATATARP